MYHHKIQTKKRTALPYYAFIIITSQKDRDLQSRIYKPLIFPLLY